MVPVRGTTRGTFSWNRWPSSDVTSVLGTLESPTRLTSVPRPVLYDRTSGGVPWAPVAKTGPRGNENGTPLPLHLSGDGTGVSLTCGATCTGPVEGRQGHVFGVVRGDWVPDSCPVLRPGRPAYFCSALGNGPSVRISPF